MENKLRAAGLRNRLHVAGIARAAKCMHDGFDPALMLTGAMFADSAGDAPNDVTICVEGNISAGKSTFLEAVKATPFGQNNLRIVPEPVERWTAVQAHVGDTAGLAGLSDGAKELNILQKFYENSDRWAYTFQSWVFFTRFMQERDSNAAWNAAVAAQSAATKPRGRRGGRATAASRSAAAAAAAFMTPPPAVQHRLMERSVFSDRMVFVEALKGDGKLSPLEAAIYDQWFTFMLQDRPSLVPDAFIYLRASPEVCQRRMKLRGRAEESPVKIDYLSLLHEKHDNWFTLRSKQDGAAYGNLSGASGAVHSGTGSLVWKEKGREGELATWVGSSLQMRAQQGQDASSGGWDDVAAAVRDATYGLLPPSLHGKVQFLDLGQALGGASASACKLPANAQRRVPALVLDCDDANLVSSEDDKKYYGDMVKEFYSYVENLKLQVWTPMRRFAAGNAASGLGGGNTADDEAEVNAERERMRQRMEALCASFTRRGGASTSSGGVVLPTPAQTAVLGSKMAMRG